MRRVLALLVGVAFVLAGCGSSSSPASSALSGELSYFPVGSPFVMTVATSATSGSAQLNQALIKRLPVASFGETALLAKLGQLGLSYSADIRPLFGNPVVFGLADDGTGAQAGKQVLFVWKTGSASALQTLVKKLAPTASSTGTHDGATLYELGSTDYAVDGATVLLSSSAAVLTAALDRHAQNQGITPAAYATETAGLPKGAAVEAFGNLVGVLSKPSTASARRVPWVSALRGYATAVSASAGGLTFQYRIDTSGGSLTGAQLPIVGGTTAPSLAGALPIEFALRDPGQTIAFVESAQQAASPSKYAGFETRQSRLRRKTGVDLNSLLSLLTGNLIIGSDTKQTIGRVTVTNPTQASQVLSKLATDPRDVFPHASSLTRLPGGVYAIKQRAETITVGIVGHQLVAGKATRSELTAFATAPTSPAAGAQGAAAFRIALPEVIKLAVKHPSKIEQTILSVLGDVTGWTQASPSGLIGSTVLALNSSSS